MPKRLAQDEPSLQMPRPNQRWAKRQKPYHEVVVLDVWPEGYVQIAGDHFKTGSAYRDLDVFITQYRRIA